MAACYTSLLSSLTLDHLFTSPPIQMIQWNTHTYEGILKLIYYWHFANQSTLVYLYPNGYSNISKSSMHRSMQSTHYSTTIYHYQVQVSPVSCIATVFGSTSESTSKWGSIQTLSSTLKGRLCCHTLSLPPPPLHTGLFCMSVSALFSILEQQGQRTQDKELKGLALHRNREQLGRAHTAKGLWQWTSCRLLEVLEGELVQSPLSPAVVPLLV